MVTCSNLHHASGVLVGDTLARLTIQLTRGHPCMLLSCKFHYLIWVLVMVLKEGGEEREGRRPSQSGIGTNYWQGLFKTLEFHFVSPRRAKLGGSARSSRTVSTTPLVPTHTYFVVPASGGQTFYTSHKRAHLSVR